MSKLEKLFILLTGFFIAVIGYVFAYWHFSANLTTWQLSQNIDWQTGSGSTKFLLYINSFTAAGIAFIVSVIGMLLVVKYKKNLKRKKETK